MSITVTDIQRAATTLAAELPITPVCSAPRLSRTLGVSLFLKLETQHHTGSFKERGALNKLKSLSVAERDRGVVAMSAGNHAQAVAHHATRLGLASTIVMPAMTPFSKVERTKALGATVVIHGDTLDQAERHAYDLAEQQGLMFIHPYNDRAIIAGQGTLALEFLKAVPSLEVLVVPVGGGGLISGVAVAAKAMKPGITVIGVEAALYPSMRQVLDGRPVECGGVTLAEGIAVKAPGDLCSDLVRRTVDDLVVVDEASLERAVYEFVSQQKLVVEGAGAAGLAAVMADPSRFAGRTVGLITCGGNIDDRILAQVMMRGLVREGRLVRLRIGLVDVPGVLARIAGVIGDAGGNIVEVRHQRLFYDVPVKMAELEVVVETRDRTHIDDIIARLSASDFTAHVLPDTVGVA